MLEYYGDSVVQALLDIYPKIGLHEDKFLITNSIYLMLLLFQLIFNLFFTDQYWKQETNQRNFFDKFALKHDLEPLLANTWYSISRSSIVAEKV